MFDVYNYVARMQAVKDVLQPAHFEFIALAQTGALGFTTQQICSANPFGRVPSIIATHESK
jgi:hypothetical protein